MAKQVMANEKLCKYLCESEQLSLDLSSESEDEFTNKITVNDFQ